MALGGHYSQKIILAKTQYKIHDDELLAIIEAFKTWWYYLKSCKHKVFCLYQSQQPLPFHGHKKPEFLLGLVGPKTFSLLFLDKLLLTKSK